jgi:bacillolysin
MKKIVILFCFISLFFNGYSQIQSNVFKKVQRQAVDTTKKSFTPVIINGNKTQIKSGRLKQRNSHFLNTSPSIDATIKVKNSKTSQLPVFIERSSLKTKSAKSNSVRCYEFLEDVKNYTGIANPRESFFISKEQTDEIGQTHIRMYQKFKGIEVYGSDFYVHLKSDKEQFNGNYHIITNQVDTLASVAEDQAIEICFNDLKTKTKVLDLSAKEKQMLNYEKPQIKLVLKEVEGMLKTYKLMYQITVRPNFVEEWIYFIGANDGVIYKNYNNTKYDGPTTATAYDLNNVLRPINTYLEEGTYYVKNCAETMYNVDKDEGYILTLDAQNTQNPDYVISSNNTWSNKAAVSAQYNATLTYRYLKNTLKRNSINDKGGNILSVVNFSDEKGNGLDNAFWNGGYVFMGNGGSNCKNLAGSLDVMAHEIGHGVVENTANLEYKDQSGAINETYADIFGSMVDRDDWYIGEDITKSTFIQTGRMRDMSNPHNGGGNGWQPMHTSEMYVGSVDYGGVHSNSGIGNYAYYLYATALTKEKAEQVFYRALKEYLTSTAQFIDFRIAVIQSATDLYGENSTEVVRAQIAFDAVGIYDDAGNNYLQDYTANPGTQYLCYYDLDQTHPSSFYASNIIGQNPIGLTAKLANSRMSFTDNGAFGVYVSSTNTIRSVNTNTLEDKVIQSQPIWANAVISKDGKRLAAVTTVSDTAIWVYDFGNAKWAKFHLYNPTTSSDNQISGGVLFSDAFEFDVTGESIIYDAYNTLNTNSGKDFFYWDIGFVNVWDNQTNNFGDGTIMKLYGSLPENVSIGNPTFSKNSPYIIAFDYLDESTNEFAIFGENILTGDVSVISLNTAIGYPSYTKDDDVLVFTSKNGTEEAVKGIILAKNKISKSASTSPVLLVNKAKWGVCFATGQRDLGLPPVANFTASFKTGKTPLNVQFFDISVNDPVAWFWTFEGGSPSTSIKQNPIVSYSTGGTYKVILKATNGFGENIITKNSYVQVAQSVLSISSSALTISSSANSTKTFDISSNTSWTTSSNQNWLTVSKNTGTGNSAITLTATANPTTAIRTATITVSGTGVTAQTITVTQDGWPTGVDNITEKEYIIYPNPTSNILYFNVKADNVLISIFDFNGKIILTKEVNDNHIDISNLQNGIYTIKIEDKTGIIIEKLVKQ